MSVTSMRNLSYELSLQNPDQRHNAESLSLKSVWQVAFDFDKEGVGKNDLKKVVDLSTAFMIAKAVLYTVRHKKSLHLSQTKIIL